MGARPSSWARRAPLLPALIFMIVVTQLPFVATLVISFMDWNAYYPDQIGFNGLDNYIYYRDTGEQTDSELPIYQATGTDAVLLGFEASGGAEVVPHLLLNGSVSYVRGTISEYIPNPTFDVVARPGAQEDYFRHGNPGGLSRREIFGEPIRAVPAFREPEPRLELMDAALPPLGDW